MAEQPVCQMGYDREQIQRLVGHRLLTFDDWMRGQTVALCDGKLYDHDKREYVRGCETPHGIVVYPWDLERFLAQGGAR